MLYAVAPVIGALYLLAFIYGILAIIYGMVSKWPGVAVPVLFFAGPSAKAYRLLERIDLGPDLGRSGDGPHLQFREGGGNQFDYSLHAHASDMLALSLLQARLIDLRLPIKVERWKD